MRTVYRWGILAPGKIAKKFATGLAASPRAQLYAVASRDLQRSNEFAGSYDIEIAYDSYQHLAADPKVDVIYIANPHTFHMDSTLLCLKHGKAVLCEKPLALNSQQVKRMTNASKEYNSFLMEALWSRFLPHIIKARQLIQQGVIGKLRSLEADFGFQAGYDPQSRLFNPALGGGALLDIGIYPLFLAGFIMGQPLDVLSTVHLAPTGVDQEGEVLLKYEEGRHARLHFTLTRNTPVEAKIEGDKGIIMLHNRWYQPGNLTLVQDNQSKLIEIDLEGNGYHYQAEEVMRCLDQQKIESPEWSHSHSWKLMQLMDEIRRQGKVVYEVD